MKTHYDILGVAPDADYNTIKTAYRKAVKAHHPDLHLGNASAERLSRRIIAAHTVLKNAERRSRYDEYLRRRKKGRRLSLMTGLASAFVVASGALIIMSMVWRQEVRLPVPISPGGDARAIAKADNQPPQAAVAETPSASAAMTPASAASDDPEEQDIPAELMQPDPEPAVAEQAPAAPPQQTAAREAPEKADAADPMPPLIPEQLQALAEAGRANPADAKPEMAAGETASAQSAPSVAAPVQSPQAETELTQQPAKQEQAESRPAEPVTPTGTVQQTTADAQREAPKAESASEGAASPGAQVTAQSASAAEPPEVDR
jgi:curved DNA-binding protein CbpA